MFAACRPLLFACLGLPLLFSACIINSVVPEEDELGDGDVYITEPVSGEELNPIGQEYVRGEIGGFLQFPAELKILLNDSLLIRKIVERRMSFREAFFPGDWAGTGLPLVVKIVLTDAANTVIADSVEVRVGDYFSVPPVLLEPSAERVFFISGSSTFEFETEDYVSDYSETYEYCIATDSLFVDTIQHEMANRRYTYTIPAAGSYYWRVRAIGFHDIQSPWSGTRRFHVMDGATVSPDFLSMSQITRVVTGAQGIYLLGRDGSNAAVMKCDDQLHKVWQVTMDNAINAGAMDCDELDDGGLYVIADQVGGYSSYDEWIYLLSADGETLWERDMAVYNDPTSIRATSDGMLICGFSSNYSPFIAKMDTTETTEWELDSANDPNCFRLVGDRAEGRYQYLSRGNNGSYSFGEIDLAGETIWSSSLNLAITTYNPTYVMTPLADGSFVIGSSVYVSSSHYVYLAKIGSNGDLIWQAHLDNELGADGRRYLGAVREHEDGSLFMIGSWNGGHYSYSDDVLLARLTADGAVEWVRTYGSTELDESGQDLVILEDRLMLFGYQTGGASNAALALSVDFDGKVLFE